MIKFSSFQVVLALVFYLVATPFTFANFEEEELPSVQEMQFSSLAPSYYSYYPPSTTEVEIEWKVLHPSTESFSQKLFYSINGEAQVVILNESSIVEINSEENYYLCKYTIHGLKAGSRVKWSIEATAGGDVEVTSNTYLFYVEKSDKIIFVTQDGIGSGSSWGDASNLNDALKNYTYGDQLWLRRGVYTPTSSSDRTKRFEIEEGIEIYGGFIGVETDFSQRDWIKNRTILSGNIGDPELKEDNSYNIVYIRGLYEPITEATKLDGLTIEGGYADSSPDVSGAGLKLSNASPTIVNVHFRNNYARVYGGAAQCDMRSGAKFYNCLFDNNKADDRGGAFMADGSVQFINCVFFGNEAGRRGGALDGPSMPTQISIYNSILWGNRAPTGDQIYGTFDILYVIIEGYEATGRIYNENPGFVNAEDGDYRLIQNAYALNRGSNNYVPEWLTTDFVGNNRILANQVDIGIYEGAIHVPEIVSPTNLAVFDYQTEEIGLSWTWIGGTYFESYTLEYKVNGGESVIVNSLDETDYIFTDVAPESDVSWRIGVKLEGEDKKLWSPWRRFIIGRDRPIYVKNNGIGEGTSWEDATTLQNAMEIALYGDEIWVGSGTYRPTFGDNRNATFSVADGVKLYGGFSGTETSLSQRNFLLNPTMFSGNIGATNNEKDNSYNVFRIEGTASNPITEATVIDGIYIEGGYATLNAGSRNSGAGMYLEYASPTVTNVVFRYNYASRDGGAVYVGTDSSPRFGNIVFFENESAGFGGAVYTIQNATIYNSIFYGNRSQHGGSISSEGRNTNIYNSIFWSNNSGNENYVNLHRVKASYCIIDNGEGDNNIITEFPEFKNPHFFDFSFDENSPAVNAGSNDYIPEWLTTDYFGNERIVGDAVDIGVFEHPNGPTTTNITYVDLFRNIDVWPNPIAKGDDLFVKFSDVNNSAKASLINSSGIIIREWENISKDSSHNLGSLDLPVGIYIFTLSFENGDVKTKKILIK